MQRHQNSKNSLDENKATWEFHIVERTLEGVGIWKFFSQCWKSLKNFDLTKRCYIYMFQCLKSTYLHLRQNTTQKKIYFWCENSNEIFIYIEFFLSWTEKNLIEIRWSERNDSCNALDIRRRELLYSIVYTLPQKYLLVVHNVILVLNV